MPSREPPTFDLVVATVGRAEELRRLLASLERQNHPSLRVLVVDQNDDDRVARVLAENSKLDLVHLRAERGLSRARNAALPHLRGDVVGFPDDDCEYPEGLLERVATRLVDSERLDGLTGRAADESGRSSPSWRRDRALLTSGDLWNRAISFAIFLRRSLVEQVGRFDEELGLGSGRPWESGEEIDYLVRAVRAGARIEYDPELVVLHPHKPLSRLELRSIAFRDGASVGYILRKHGYDARTTARMLVRPLGGAGVSVLRGDAARAGFHLATLQGRLAGYRGGRRSSGRGITC